MRYKLLAVKVVMERRGRSFSSQRFNIGLASYVELYVACFLQGIDFLWNIELLHRNYGQ
jgi:hypothetical protein